MPNTYGSTWALDPAIIRAEGITGILKKERQNIMSNNQQTSAPELAEVLSKFSPDEIAAFVAKFNAETNSVSEANKVLDAKMYPEDSRGFQPGTETLHTVDSVRETLFSVAATLAENIVVTDPANPNGGNKNTRSDRRQIEIPTPSGTLNIRLTHYAE